ncbi:uncharacterized protein LOC118191937 [Stegodyphus dumicola]|uniref:uncharacterized protein LOC118191937 n=1 Tax=Stegodyphus dumicola TaxID=202533 RepID=UPI0015A9CD57|nr:uncharacterized protein LOC118191937 [Stegodyphus dumicola]
MKPQVKYLLECYMKERGLYFVHEANEERSGSLSLPLLNDFVDALPAELQGVIGGAQNAHEGALNAQQRQRIRTIARNLRLAADRIHIRRPRSLLSVERAVLLNEGLNEEEIRVVRNMHTVGPQFSVSSVAECLNNCLTSRTVKAALRFLSYTARSVSEELALACELSSLILPNFIIPNFVRSSSVEEAISEFIEDRLDMG